MARVIKSKDGAWQKFSDAPSLSDMPDADEAVKILNVRQRKFLDEYIDTGNKTQSAIDAGFSGQYGREILQNPTIATALQTMLASAGIGNAAIAISISRLLNSNKGPDVARGVDLLIKVRGDAAPKKSIAVKVDYSDYAKTSLNGDKAHTNTAQQSQQPTEEGGVGVALSPTVSVLV